MIDRRIALALGGLVLGAVIGTSWWLLTASSKPERFAPAPAPAVAVAPAGPGLQPAGRAADLSTAPQPILVQQPVDARPRLRGVVLLPDGRPASGAAVTLYRQTSAWPEWRRVMLDTAITGSTGTFQFATERSTGLLVDFLHADFAGGLREAPPSLPQLQLRLQPGFEVEGVVQNDLGLPMSNVRVALESMLADDRSVRTAETTSSGRFRFTNVAVGAMRVVARHDKWQPIVQTNVVVGVNRTLELRFDRPALAIDGRVLAAGTQEPVGGAIVYALPPGQLLGRNDPAATLTRSDGTFRLAGLAPGNLRLEIRHDAFATVTRSIVVGPQPLPLAIDLPLRSRVHGHLRGVGLELARGASLTLRSVADELTSASVEADGAFAFVSTVTPGLATLSVTDGRFAFSTGASVLQVQVEDAGGEGVLELEIGPPAVVAGRIVGEDGQPIAGAHVTARQAGIFAERIRQAGNALLDRDLRRFGDQFTRTATGGPEQLLAVTGTDGTFQIAGLAPGPVELRMACSGYGGQRLDCEVPPCGQTSSVPAAVLHRGGRIRGQAQRGGRPLAGAQVGVVVDGLALAAVTGIDGRYELADLPAGDFRVRARYSTFPTVLANDPVALRPGGDAVVDLEFPPGRVVRGVVAGSSGQPVEGALVLVRGEPGNPVLTDSNGAFALEAPNRSVELQVGFGDRGVRKIVPIEVGAEDVTVQIDAAPNCTITATVLGLPGRKQLAGVLLRIAHVGGDNTATQSRWVELHGGRLRDPWFPAGEWQVTIWSEGYAPLLRRLDLQAGGDHAFGELLLEPGCELQGIVHGEQGRPFAGAEVFLGEEGDLDVFEAQTKTGADGRFTVRGVSSLASSLVVRAPGHAWQVLPLRLPQDVLGGVPLVVTLQRGATIEVQVAAADAAGSMVVLRRAGRVLATAEVDDDGKAVFANRGTGDYVVQRFGDERRQVPVRVDEAAGVVRVRL